MGWRYVVVVAFVAMAGVPAYLAYDTGVLPAPSQASAEETVVGPVSRVTSLAWPDEGLGLATGGGAVLWEQRDRTTAASGLWSYDTRTGRIDKVLGRSAIGKASGFPAAAGDLVVWATWPTRRDSGTPRIEAYNTATTRHWTAAAEGRDPMAAGESVVWVEPDGAGPGKDTIRGINRLTDEEFAIATDGRVRDADAWGSRAVWITGRGEDAEVWTGSFRAKARRQLAGAGTAVAADRDRIAWAMPVGRHSTAIVAWDRRSRRTTEVYRMVGTVSSLSLGRKYATWVATREVSGPKVWAYDFARGEAFPVAAGDGRQASPVIVFGSLYWAEHDGGGWALYRRSLRP